MEFRKVWKKCYISDELIWMFPCTASFPTYDERIIGYWLVGNLSNLYLWKNGSFFIAFVLKQLLSK